MYEFPTEDALFRPIPGPPLTKENMASRKVTDATRATRAFASLARTRAKITKANVAFNLSELKHAKAIKQLNADEQAAHELLRSLGMEITVYKSESVDA